MRDVDYDGLRRYYLAVFGDQDRAQEAVCWAWEFIGDGLEERLALWKAWQRVSRGSLWAERTQGKRVAAVDCDTDAVGAVAKSREIAPDRLAQVRTDLDTIRARLDADDRVILDGVLNGQDRAEIAAALDCTDRRIRQRIGALADLFAGL